MNSSKYALITSFLLIVVIINGTIVSVTAQNDSNSDKIGVENGTSHDEVFRFSPPYTERQIQKIAERAAARVEYIRGVEFEEVPKVNIITRKNFSGFDSGGNLNSHNRWNNQVWEALFIVGENNDISNEIDKVTESGVVGYYNHSDDELYIITNENSSSSTRIDERTLIHEMVHSYQDQKYDLTKEKYQGLTQDEQLAVNSLIEGEAIYITKKFDQKCSIEWSCLNSPSSVQSQNSYNNGVYLILYMPYSDGSNYVNHLYKNGGWSSLESKFKNPPKQTREILHPERKRISEYKTNIQDTGFDDWRRFDVSIGRDGGDSLGQASVTVMFWYQAAKKDIMIDNVEPIEGVDTTYDYSSRISDGLLKDRIVPYKNDTKGGYVWKTVWFDEENATQFKKSYIELLKGHDAIRKNNSWIIQRGDFEDSFNIKQSGNVVFISNGPNPSVSKELMPDKISAENVISGENSGFGIPEITYSNISMILVPLFIIVLIGSILWKDI